MPSFQLPEEQTVRVSADELLARTARLLRAAGVPAEDAALAADGLVSADLRGVDTHGVSNMLRWYLYMYREKLMNPTPAWRVTRETPATANIDSDGGLGLVVTPKAMALAIEKARAVGMGVVTLHNARHLGMAQYHALLALPHDMIGVCLTASGPYMVPTYGRDPRLGTNPIAVAAPCATEPPFVFDAATTAIAGNKVIIAHRLGVPLPPGVLAEDDGTPIAASIAAPSAYTRLLPLGSLPEMGSHKGYGLACVVEVLTNLLGGLTFATRLGRTGHNHCVMALDINGFSDVAEFKQTMDEFVQMLKATPPAPGCERVLVPGQPEWEAEQERRVRGIPLHREVLAWFEQTEAEMQV